MNLSVPKEWRCDCKLGLYRRPDFHEHIASAEGLAHIVVQRYSDHFSPWYGSIDVCLQPPETKAMYWLHKQFRKWSRGWIDVRFENGLWGWCKAVRSELADEANALPDPFIDMKAVRAKLDEDSREKTSDELLKELTTQFDQIAESWSHRVIYIVGVSGLSTWEPADSSARPIP